MTKPKCIVFNMKSIKYWKSWNFVSLWKKLFLLTYFRKYDRNNSKTFNDERFFEILKILEKKTRNVSFSLI